MGRYYDPYQTVDERAHRLPHWQQGAVPVLATWRLFDSLPQEQLRSLRLEKTRWLELHPMPWDEAIEREYHELFSARIDKWLDAGVGECHLKCPDIQSILANTLHHFDGDRYVLEAYVLMPNHVHVLFTPSVHFRLSKIIQSWKGFSARAINRKLGRVGALWQDSYWDRLIRSEVHWKRSLQYIADNPKNAKLPKSSYALYVREYA